MSDEVGAMRLMAMRADRGMMLRVYLNDHLAIATGMVRLAKRGRGENAGTPLAAFLDELLAELGEDRDTIRSLLDELELPVSLPKQAAAVAAELTGRLKLNGQLVGYSALGRLYELESLAAGLDANRSLWLALAEVTDPPAPLAALDLGHLAERAGEWRHALEVHRRTAAADAFAAATGDTAAS